MKSTSGRSAFFLALLLTIFWAVGAHAKAITLDDSGSQALEPAVNMRWRSAHPQPGNANLMVGTTTIRVRINVMAWMRRSVRIYLALPAQQPGPLGLSWTTQGRLMTGELRSGNRQLVYAGPITAPFLEDVFRFQFTMSGSLLTRALPVSYHFEMDED